MLHVCAHVHSCGDHCFTDSVKDKGMCSTCYINYKYTLFTVNYKSVLFYICLTRIQFVSTCPLLLHSEFGEY